MFKKPAAFGEGNLRKDMSQSGFKNRGANRSGGEVLVKPAPQGRVRRTDAVRAGDEKPRELVNLLQKHRYLGVFPGTRGDRAVVQERIGFVDNQNRARSGCAGGRCRDPLFRLAQILRKQIRWALEDHVAAEPLSKPQCVLRFALMESFP